MFFKIGSVKLFLVLVTSLILWGTGCRQEKPTPLSLPTFTETAISAATSAPTETAEPVPTESVPTESMSPQPARATPTDVTLPTATPTASPEVESLPPFPPQIALEPALSGFEAPVYLTFASQTEPWRSRLFVVEKPGRIRLVENGQIQPTPFLDIVERVGSSGSEQGLLSVAFAPDFVESQLFYVNYTDRDGNTVVARYRLMEGDPLRGDVDSEQKILELAQPAGNHNGGQLQFGPDGYLYVGTGDGGRAGDPWGNAQNPEVLLGKLLRVDVAGAETYDVPDDNPFVDWTDVRPEIWALGLRNPWRFSFDRATGDLYIADVGQNSYEEVDFQAAGSTGGENYGWDIMEGTHCFEPQSGCDTQGLIPPVAEYDHGQGCSITGGYVYRGGEYPALEGVYFYGDYCSGRVWALRRAPSGGWEAAQLLDTDVTISSFGQDAAGELYLLGYTEGVVYRLVAQP